MTPCSPSLNRFSSSKVILSKNNEYKNLLAKKSGFSWSTIFSAVIFSVFSGWIFALCADSNVMAIFIKYASKCYAAVPLEAYSHDNATLETVKLTIISFKYCLAFISVLSGMLVLLTVTNSPWHKKLVSAQYPARHNSHNRPCYHPFTSRKHLFGENDFQKYKNIRCAGNNPVIKGVRDNSGSRCIEQNCHGKVFCGDNTCICKSTR